jgi:hypothetical protein
MAARQSIRKLRCTGVALAYATASLTLLVHTVGCLSLRCTAGEPRRSDRKGYTRVITVKETVKPEALDAISLDDDRDSGNDLAIPLKIPGELRRLILEGHPEVKSIFDKFTIQAFTTDRAGMVLMESGMTRSRVTEKASGCELEYAVKSRISLNQAVAEGWLLKGAVELRLGTGRIHVIEFDALIGLEDAPTRNHADHVTPTDATITWRWSPPPWTKPGGD